MLAVSRQTAAGLGIKTADIQGYDSQCWAFAYLPPYVPSTILRLSYICNALKGEN